MGGDHRASRHRDASAHLSSPREGPTSWGMPSQSLLSALHRPVGKRGFRSGSKGDVPAPGATRSSFRSAEIGAIIGARMQALAQSGSDLLSHQANRSALNGRGARPSRTLPSATSNTCDDRRQPLPGSRQNFSTALMHPDPTPIATATRPAPDRRRDAVSWRERLRQGTNCESLASAILNWPVKISH